MTTPPIALDLWLAPGATFTAIPNAGRLGKIRVTTKGAEVDLLLGSALSPTTAAALMRRLESAASVLAAHYDGQSRAAAEARAADLRGEVAR